MNKLFAILIFIGFLFSDYALEDCLKYGEENSPYVKQSEIKLQIIELTKQIRKAATDPNLRSDFGFDLKENINASLDVSKKFLPGLSGSGAFSLLKGNRTRVVQGVSNTFDVMTPSFSVGLTKRIIGSGAFYSEESFALLATISAQLQQLNLHKMNIRENSSKIREKYYQLYREQKRLELKKIKVQIAKQNYEHAVIKEEPLDIATAKLEIPQAELDVKSALRTIETRKEELKLLMGFPLEKPFEIFSEFNITSRDNSATDFTNLFLNLQETLLNSKLDETLQKQTIKKVKSEVLPNLDIKSTFTHSLELSNSVQVDQKNDAKVSLVLSMPLGARKERNQVLVEIQKLEEMVGKREIFTQERLLEIRDSLRQLETAREVIAVQKENFKLQENLVRIYRDLWENGDINITEFIRNQNSLEQIKLSIVESEVNYMSILSRLNFISGM